MGGNRKYLSQYQGGIAWKEILIVEDLTSEGGERAYE